MMVLVSWDPMLIGVSFLVAFIASFVALDCAAKITLSQRKTDLFWRFAAGATLGLGIWSMHFIGMLSMRMAMPMRYDFPLTFISLLVAIGSAIAAISIAVSGSALAPKRWIMATGILSGGVVTMHYTGMSALIFHGAILWSKPLIALSVLVALVACGTALWLTFSLRQRHKNRLSHRILAAMVMGLAVAAVHYIGMGAATFGGHGADLAGGLSEHGLSLWVTATTLLLLGCMLMFSTIDSQVRTTRLTENLEQLNLQLERQSRYDALTGLANRIQMDVRLEECLRSAQHVRATFAVMVMDLDGFKFINDTLGHAAGDRLLMAVANRLSARLRPKMLLARLGDDEFMLLVPDTSEGEATDLIAGILDAVRRPVYEAGQLLNLSLSAGVAMFPRDGENSHQLKMNAATAMNSVKLQGHNNWAMYNPHTMQPGTTTVMLEQDVMQALALQQFELWYQPIYSNGTEALHGFEALLRWRHPVNGIVMPDAFLPALEKNGQILPVGQWVIEEACRQLNAWSEEGHDELTLSITLSAIQFEQEEIHTLICSMLEKYSVSPARLTLKIVESIALNNLERSLRMLTAFMRSGLTLAIDNFGTGYTNVMLLKDLPVQQLKINRSLIKDIRYNGKNMAIVSNIIEVAHSMHMSVVAQGIETVEQKHLLSSLGCDYLQGFLLAHPMPASEIAELLQRRVTTAVMPHQPAFIDPLLPEIKNQI
ncbi:bifunctional diguanylate cyclase/phosphodiesterase [Superficieibacter sp. 1612_C1]|uniref:putative bifunctional diguanylate cyclase/phosphodiesterase n=1 Tax=Superficieibacter sp. 1612_C1 TaxID=2780382 RepID=UPI001883AF3F|nr:EAL domain-containing protein [Superficieibacter sp. 1612_C1]